MCGIVGQINFTKRIDIQHFNQMRDTMLHRGPDDADTILLNNSSVALGHRRLSIIDLSNDGRQPISNEDGTIWITFNGEIYNYAILRTELISFGHKFKSHTDTEVLIHGFEQWGISGLLSRVKGMFAFGLWDCVKSELYLVRDRFGIKPLYYYHDERMLIFASEIKAIVRNLEVDQVISTSALADFFTYSYIPHPKSIWTKISKLPPAHLLYFSLADNEMKVERYWSIKVDNLRISDDEAIEKTNFLLRRSVKDHLVSDVPVGLFLSGGYDSSSLLMHTKDLGTDIVSYSIGFENSNKSEHEQAAKIAQVFDSEHRIKIILNDYKNLDLLNELAFYFDEPFAISSMIPYFLVAKFASENCKVVLAGDGGDEAFAGYRWHYDISNNFNDGGHLNRLKLLLSGKKKLLIEKYASYLTGVSSEVIRSGILSPEITQLIRQQGFWNYDKYYTDDDDLVKIYQQLDLHTFIPEPCLTRADRSSMASSLEVRVPFLDHEIFEFTLGLNSSCYLKKGYKKFLIYENIKNRLPPDILSMPKRGFSYHHLKALVDNRDVEQLLTSGELVSRGILKRSMKSSELSVMLRFHLLVLELWFRKWS